MLTQVLGTVRESLLLSLHAHRQNISIMMLYENIKKWWVGAWYSLMVYSGSKVRHFGYVLQADISQYNASIMKAISHDDIDDCAVTY